MNQSKLEANTCSQREARKNVRERVTIGFGFTPDWLRNWREIFKPITKRSNAKPKQTQFPFDTQVKTALFPLSFRFVLHAKYSVDLQEIFDLFCVTLYSFTLPIALCLPERRLDKRSKLIPSEV